MLPSVQSRSEKEFQNPERTLNKTLWVWSWAQNLNEMRFFPVVHLQNVNDIPKLPNISKDKMEQNYDWWYKTTKQYDAHDKRSTSYVHLKQKQNESRARTCQMHRIVRVANETEGVRLYEGRWYRRAFYLEFPEFPGFFLRAIFYLANFSVFFPIKK